jgi:hypothetical protein
MVVFIGGLMHSWPIIMVAACNAICFNVAAPVQRLRFCSVFVQEEFCSWAAFF